ncbi:hypothetical protein A2U01_0106906, partial [Trifolium medium]|nr:hypothetical protein [Trifolium medium]
MNSPGEDHGSLGERLSPALANTRQDSPDGCLATDWSRQLSLGLASRE